MDAKREDVVPERKLGIDREQFEDIMKRRFFFAPAFAIYSGVAGLYDYGPPLTAIKANLLTNWRNHFILEVCLSCLRSVSVVAVVASGFFFVSSHGGVVVVPGRHAGD